MYTNNFFFFLLLSLISNFNSLQAQNCAQEPVLIAMKNTSKVAAKPGIAKTKTKPKSKINKKSQRVKDKETQKGLDSLLSTSSIFADLHASKPEVQKAEKEKKIQEKKSKAKAVNDELLTQLENIGAFNL